VNLKSKNWLFILLPQKDVIVAMKRKKSCQITKKYKNTVTSQEKVTLEYHLNLFRW